MVPSLPLLSCELSVSVKKNPDRKKKGFNFSFKMQFLSFSGSKNPEFLPAGPFFLVQ